MLTTENNQLYLDGEPFRIYSGSIHYFRVVKDYWKDRLQKLKACGFNTVETYIPWNFHEPAKGKFLFEGMRDIEAFIRLAEEEGLYVILRPAPYICAEWEMGGLPAWLLKEEKLQLRCSDPRFLAHLEAYYDHLLPLLKRYQYVSGGPVIAFQIENEYGAYGDDKEYLREIERMYRKHGITEMLFTSDGPPFMEAGSLPDIWTTLNFGSRAEEAFHALDQMKPGEPRMCMEYWIGWFDAWGRKHHMRDDDSTGVVLQNIIDLGGSVNFYMFHGGTNFHFYNGANHYETYEPTITSYDYDALLTESGRVTEKYKTVQRILQASGQTTGAVPEAAPMLPEQEVTMTKSVSIFDTLHTMARKETSVTPLTMEELDQAYGFILYRTHLEGNQRFSLELDTIQDRAFIYVDKEHIHTYYRNDEQKTLDVELGDGVHTLELFVENMGRVNYGKYLQEKKGLTSNLWLGGRYTFNWEMFVMDAEYISLDFKNQSDARYPKFYEGAIHVDVPADTFIRLDGWKKGNVFINGFNLGRYWEIGPQQTLYLPGPLLKPGQNTIHVLELEGNETGTLSLVNRPDLGEGEQ